MHATKHRTKIKIDKFVFGGQGMGKTPDGKVAFAWNALPGEEVELDIIKNKKNHIEANAARIIVPSSNRKEPKEEHFLSCSPWQILSFDEENRWKVNIAQETYAKIGGLPDSAQLEIAADPDAQYGYRNKMEYSFRGGGDGVVGFAFFERGRKQHTPIDTCALAHPKINETARDILHWINEQKIPLRSLKSLIVRTNGNGNTIAGLFIKDKLSFEQYPELHNGFVGSAVYYSTHKSPASVPTALLYESGQTTLTEEIRGVELSYGLLSFFQINVPLFCRAQNDIAEHIEPDANIVDYYSGVGAIGLSLAKDAASCALVDNAEENIAYAKENIRKNGLTNCGAVLSPAERMTECIQSDATIIVDPPRAGLHDRMIRTLLAVKPKKIIYLSCNIATHARDIRLLSYAYRVSFLKLYNFFPRTPHIEGLCVFERH